MPKMKLKFDFSGVKKFFLEKGERVALFAFGGIALLLIVLTFLGALSFGKPEKHSTYEEGFDKGAKALEGRLATLGTATGAEGGKDEALAPPPPWPTDWFPRVFFQDPFFQLPEKLDTKRRRPGILKPREERIFVKVLNGGYFAHDVKPAESKVRVFKGGAPGVGMPPMGPPKGPRDMAPVAGAGEGLHPVKIFKTARFAMVGLVFPMKAQAEAHRAALRLSSLEELLAKPELVPQPRGLIVYRYEKQGSGDWSKTPLPLFEVNLKTGDTAFDERNFKKTREMMQYAIYDRNEPHAYGTHVVGGLMNPLPLLANIEIPAIELDGITVDKDILQRKVNVADAGMPPDKGGPMGIGIGRPKFPGAVDPKKGGGEDAVGRETEWVDYDKMPAEKARFTGKINAFPSRADLMGGGVADPKGGIGMPPGMPPMIPPPKGPKGDRPKMGEGDDPVGGAVGELPDEALIRFIDADILPGRSYKYFVKVRMTNPNYKALVSEVAYEGLTTDLEIVDKDARSFYEVAREVTPDSEFNFYIVDETPKSEVPGSNDSPKRYPAAAWGKGDAIAVQIHRWVRDVSPFGSSLDVGDWAITERLLTRKGEFIGRANVKVEIPMWTPNVDAFTLLTVATKEKKADKKTKGEVAGVAVDFSGDYSANPTNPRKYALVDFDGGKMEARLAGSAPVKEEATINALILTPEGRLEVRSSRHHAPSTERLSRLESWRKRIKETVTGGEGGGDVGGFPLGK